LVYAADNYYRDPSHFANGKAVFGKTALDFEEDLF